MSRADNLKEAADHFYALADLFNQMAGDDASVPVSTARPAAAAVLAAAPASFSDGTPIDEPEEWTEFAPQKLPAAAEPTGDQGFDAQCPKHRKPYLASKFKEGKFYCPADSDDPAWRNSKGKCRITPDNVATYLRVRAAA